jgi:outer membrane protein assembly factor BamB
MVLFTSRDGFLYAVDANTGEKKWAFETRVPKSEPKAPIVADRVVYLAAGVYLYAIDTMSGLAKWSLFTSMSDFSQPTKTNGLIFVSKTKGANQRNRATLLAVDASSGKVKWQIDAEGDPVGRRSPIALRDMVILGTERGLFAVDRETGTPRWNRVGGEGNYGPTYADDSLIYFAFRKGSTVDGTDGDLHALDPLTGKDRWSFSPARQIVAVLGDSICVAAKGYLYSVHKETGKELWKIDARVRTAAIPLITSDTVFIPGMTQRYVGRAPHQGYFYAIDAKSGGL